MNRTYMGGDGTPTGFGPRAHGSPLRPPPPPRHLSPPRPRHLSLPRPPTYSRRPSSPPPTELVPAPTSPAPMPEFVFSVEPPPSSPGSPSIWQIAGSVIGSVVILVLLAWLGKKRRTGKKDSESGDPSNQIAVNMAKPESNRIANFGEPMPVNNPRSTNNVRGRAPSRPKVVDIPRAAPRIFTYEELELATDGFSKSKKVGEGGFGTVYQGVLNNEFVAVKKPRSGANQGKQQLQTEIQVISQARHRHIVCLVGYYIDEDEERGKDMLLAYEFIPNGSLHSHLHGKGTKIIDWETRMKIAIGSAKGFAYLHEGCKPKIMHGDIKPHNILLLDDFQPKIADFGLAQLLSDSVTHVSMSQAQGTVGYLAPEYFEGKLSEKSDVYAFGVVLLGMITGRQPCDFRGALVKWATPRLIAALESRNFEALADPRLQNHYDPEEMFRMVSCAANCVCVSPAARPRMSKVVQALEGAIVLDNHLAEEAASRLQPQASMEAKREMALVTI